MGTGGGMRVQEQLKAMVTDMGMFTVPASVKIDTVNNKFDDEGEAFTIFLISKFKLYRN